MSCEILEYRFNVGWDLNQILTDNSFNSLINPMFPLIISTFSGMHNDSHMKGCTEFFNKRRRGRPSDLRDQSEDSVVSYVSKTLNLSGIVVRISSECASSLYSFYMASLISKENNTPVVIFCGDNKTSEYDHWYFNSFGALDNNVGLPFDDSSRGFKMGACSTLFLVKHPSVKFNIEPKAVIEKFHFYTNANHATNPGCIDDIIKNLSNVDYKNIELWNAHATGTPVGDNAEYEFFSKVITRDIPIVGYKGYVGHCLGAAGGIEIIHSLEDKANNKLRPNIIKTTTIAKDDRIITESTTFPYRKMLKISMGFGGKTSIGEILLL